MVRVTSPEVSRRRGPRSMAFKVTWSLTAGVAALVVVFMVVGMAKSGARLGELSSGGDVAFHSSHTTEQVSAGAVRRSTLAGAASSLKDTWQHAVHESTSDRDVVFAKEMKELHSAAGIARASRIALVDAATGLVERPCAPTTTTKIERGKVHRKCYLPAQPPNGGGREDPPSPPPPSPSPAPPSPAPPSPAPPGCILCLEGFYGQASSATAANTANANNRICNAWKVLAVTGFLPAQQPVPDADLTWFADAIDAMPTKCDGPYKPTGLNFFTFHQGKYCTALLDPQGYTKAAAVMGGDAFTRAVQELGGVSKSECKSAPVTLSTDVVGFSATTMTLTKYCGSDVPVEFTSLLLDC